MLVKEPSFMTFCASPEAKGIGINMNKLPPVMGWSTWNQTTGDGSCAQVWFPPTSGWNSPARATVNIALGKGENHLLLTNPIQGQKEDTRLRYSRMGEALKRNALPGRPIYFSICEHGRTQPWTWAREFGVHGGFLVIFIPNGMAY